MKFSNVPAKGNTYFTQPLDTNVQQGLSGSNVNWNFTTVTDSVAGQTVNFVAPSSTPYAAGYPSATVADSISGFFYYYEALNTNFTLNYLGLDDNVNFVSFIYNKPEVVMTYPFTYNDKFNGTFAGHNYSGVRVARTGSDSARADAYGSLSLPGGINYKNILRVKFMENYTDSAFGNKDTNVTHLNTINYSWYDSIHPVPVFSIIYTQSTGNFAPIENKYVNWNKFSTTTGIEEAENTGVDLKLFPNPSDNDLVNLLYTIKTNSDVRIQLFDYLGRQVYRSDLDNQSKGVHLQTLSGLNLNKGIYSVRIQTGDSFTSKLLVIE